MAASQGCRDRLKRPGIGGARSDFAGFRFPSDLILAVVRSAAAERQAAGHVGEKVNTFTELLRGFVQPDSRGQPSFGTLLRSPRKSGSPPTPGGKLVEK